MKRYVLFASLIIVLALSSCTNSIMNAGSGNIKKEVRTIGEITGVISLCSADITITEGTSDKIEIETDDDILPSIETTLNGGKLTIKAKQSISPTVLRVRLQMKKASTFLMKGSGSIVANGNFSGDNVHFGVTGSGNINFNSITAKNVKIEIAGSGSVNAVGKTEKDYVEITGSGNANCLDLSTDGTKVEITGSGDAFVSAEKELYISIIGSGDVEYRGNPAQLSTKTTGSGTIRKTSK